MNFPKVFRKRQHDPYTVSYIVAYSDLRSEVRKICNLVERHLEETKSSDNFTLQSMARLRLKEREIARKLAERNT